MEGKWTPYPLLACKPKPDRNQEAGGPQEALPGQPQFTSAAWLEAGFGNSTVASQPPSQLRHRSVVDLRPSLLRELGQRALQ